MRSKDPQVIAVLCADVHLSATPPVWRSTEPDWYAAMARPLDFVASLCKKHDCDLVIAGDIFDKWNPPPELINWAMNHLPHGRTFAVPGQHDLPNHRYEDIRKSGYWTLVQAEVINNLEPGKPRHLSYKPAGQVIVHGFPWRHPIVENTYPKVGHVHLAVVHDYCWKDGHSFPGCPQEKHWAAHAKNLIGYDAAVFGDNHKGLMVNLASGQTILNCGSLMRRNSDQVNYAPQVGLLRSDGRIDLVGVPFEEDKTLEDVPGGLRREADKTVKEFIDILEGLGALTADFQEACKKFMRAKRVPDEVQRVVLACLEEGVIQK